MHSMILIIHPLRHDQISIINVTSYGQFWVSLCNHGLKSWSEWRFVIQLPQICFKLCYRKLSPIEGPNQNFIGAPALHECHFVKGFVTDLCTNYFVLRPVMKPFTYIFNMLRNICKIPACWKGAQRGWGRELGASRGCVMDERNVVTSLGKYTNCI